MLGCSAMAAPTDATISNSRFSPEPLKVPVGATVRWTNEDGFDHTVTADDGSFDSGALGPNGTGTFSVIFHTGGTQSITVAPVIAGTVNVGGASTLVVGHGNRLDRAVKATGSVAQWITASSRCPQFATV